MGKTWKKRWSNDRKKSYVYGADMRTPEQHLSDSISRMRRSELYPLKDSIVPVSGVLTKTRYSLGHVLLTDVMVNRDLYFDHIWIPLDQSEVNRMQYAKKGSRVYFTATVGIYKGLQNRNPLNQHMGLLKVNLINTNTQHFKSRFKRK